MPNNTKISDLDLASQLNEADLLLLSQQESESESEEFDSKKTTVGNLAEKVATEVQFSGLQTDSKTITGAINEAAAVGKVSESYHKEILTPNSYKEWEDSETKVDGHTVYQSYYGTYRNISGDSLATWTVEGLNDVTFYIKQDGEDTSKAYTILGKADTPIDLEDESSYAISYQNAVLSEYTSYKFENLNGATKTFQILYHTDPNDPIGTATVDLTDSQFVDTGTTIDGHTVYVSNAASKCRVNLQGVSSFKIYYKAATSSSYNRIYIGELDTPVTTSDYDTRAWEQTEYYYTSFTCSKNENHYIEIMFNKAYSYLTDDSVYFYIVLNGDPHTTRGYVYAVPGQIIETNHGEIFNDYEHNFAIGINSHAEGENTLASGQSSHAEGYGTTASYYYAHAEGYNTIASNSAAHAEGHGTTASYSYAHAEGYQTTASGHASHAEGQNTTASGSECHAEGEYTVASYEQAHAEGNQTTASGSQSHAEGNQTTASGPQSHAEGKQTTASSDFAHAEGGYTVASNWGAHAEGCETVASATYSHAEGHYTKATVEGAHAEGAGNGSSDNNSNIASGYGSHTEGRITKASGEGSHSEGCYTVASGEGSHAEGKSTVASGEGSHAEGGYTLASGKYSHAEGSNLIYNSDGPNASGIAAHAEGILTVASGIGAHAEGVPAIKYSKYSSTTTYNTGDIIYYFGEDTDTTVLYFSRAKVDNVQGISPTDSSGWQYWEGYSPSDSSSYLYSDGNGHYSSTATGMGAHAEGVLTIAYSDGSHAEGTFYIDPEGNSHVMATAPGAHAEGQGSQAQSPGAHAEGTKTRAFAPSTHAEGINSQASGVGAHAEGIGTLAVANYQHVQGKYNNSDQNQAFIIGNGTSNNARSNALTVDWDGNMALAGDVTVGTSLNTTATTIGGAINEIVARIPAPPTVDGTYTLSVTVSDGVPTYSWV